MDDLDDLQASEFVTESDDQDSLDDQVELAQRHSNRQLFASFQNVACCIAKLNKDRAQPNVSPWIPFQSAASNLTSLYKDCIESQKKFAKIGYQVGRRRQAREIAKLLKKQRAAASRARQSPPLVPNTANLLSTGIINSADIRQQSAVRNSNTNNVASILAVNQLNLGCDSKHAHNISQSPSQYHVQQPISLQTDAQQEASHFFQLQHQQESQPQHLQTQSQSVQCPLENCTRRNTNDDLMTFQDPVTCAQTRGQRTNSQPTNNFTKRSCSNVTYGHRAIEDRSVMSEEERLHELSQYLSDEYHRQTGSRKRSSSSFSGNTIKRIRD